MNRQDFALNDLQVLEWHKTLPINDPKQGAFGIMVITVENDLATQVQIWDDVACISHSADNLEKGMNPAILSPTIGK